MKQSIRRCTALAALVSSIAAAGHSAELRSTDLVRRYGGAIVLIVSRTAEGHFIQGTGFLISPLGRVVTNFHVIHGATQVRVRLANGRTYDLCRVVRYDSDRDLAIL